MIADGDTAASGASTANFWSRQLARMRTAKLDRDSVEPAPVDVQR
jgi:hypothetical protein